MHAFTAALASTTTLLGVTARLIAAHNNTTFVEGFFDHLNSMNLRSLAHITDTVANTTGGQYFLDILSSHQPLTLLAPNDEVSPPY